MPQILTVTLNPALDVSTSVDALKPTQKLRCGRPRHDPGGGGVNVSRAIKKLGGESRAFVVLGGATGAHYKRLLDAEGVETSVLSGPGETRTTFQVTEEATGRQYRFVLPGPEQAKGDEERLLEALAAEVSAGAHRYVVVSGSLPPGLPTDFYARIAFRVRDLGAKCILDAAGPAFEAALAARPFLVRADRYEAQVFLGDGELNEVSVRRLAHDVLNGPRAEAAMITMGGDGAYVATADEGYRIRPPGVDVASAAGAGDSLIGALTLGLANGMSLADASRYGLAAATSAVTTEATSLCRRDQTEEFFAQTVCEAEPRRRG